MKPVFGVKLVGAACTWGEGPDVLVVLDGNQVADPVRRTGWEWPLMKHGDGTWSFGLNVEQAKALAAEILAAVASVETIEASLEAGSSP